MVQTNVSWLQPGTLVSDTQKACPHPQGQGEGRTEPSSTSCQPESPWWPIQNSMASSVLLQMIRDKTSRLKVCTCAGAPLCPTRLPLRAGGLGEGIILCFTEMASECPRVLTYSVLSAWLSNPDPTHSTPPHAITKIKVSTRHGCFSK